MTANEKLQQVKRDEYLQLQKQWALEKRQFQSQQDPLRHLFRLLEVFDQTAAWVYQQRDSSLFQPAEKHVFETELADAAYFLHCHAIEKNDQGELSFRERYHLIWVENFNVFVATFLAFLVATVLGVLIGLYHSEYTTLIAGQHLMEQVIDREAWFEELNSNPMMGAFEIAVNNIKVCIMTFVTGAVFGIGSLILVLYNGVMFGAVIGFCLRFGFHDRLLSFVATHGFLEITVIIASGFAGVLMGRGLWRGLLEERSTWQSRFRETANQAQILALGIMPWLILAGIMEGFVSPNHNVPLRVKVLLGIGWFLVFFAWTLWPRSRHALDTVALDTLVKRGNQKNQASAEARKSR